MLLCRYHTRGIFQCGSNKWTQMYNILSAIHAIYNRGYAQHHEWLANNMSSKYPHVFEINN